MPDRFLQLSKAHLLQTRLHHELVEQVPALQVIQRGQVVQAVHLLVVQEKVNSVNAHCLEEASEFEVANNGN